MCGHEKMSYDTSSANVFLFLNGITILPLKRVRLTHVAINDTCDMIKRRHKQLAYGRKSNS